MMVFAVFGLGVGLSIIAELSAGRSGSVRFGGADDRHRRHGRRERQDRARAVPGRDPEGDGGLGHAPKLTYDQIFAAMEKVRALANGRQRAGKLVWLGIRTVDGGPIIHATVTSLDAFSDLPSQVDGVPVRVQWGPLEGALGRVLQSALQL